MTRSMIDHDGCMMGIDQRDYSARKLRKTHGSHSIDTYYDLVYVYMGDFSL
jgi:hypothetical protein